MRPLAASIATICLVAGCSYPATEIAVALGSDAPADRVLHIAARVGVGVGAGEADAGAAQQWVSGGGAAGAIALPASFAVVPPRGGPRDGLVTVRIDAHLDEAGAGRPAVDFRRIARLQFQPQTHIVVPMFLAIECGNAAHGCTSVPAAACTVSVRCEEQGYTCGERGACYPVTPPTTTDAGFVAVSSDAGGDAAAADAAAPASPCAPVTIDRGFAPLRTVFVAPTGDDGADGLAPERAWRSLANAARLQPGDRVELAAGSYPCGALITVHGTADHPVQIRSTDGPGAARFDCGGADAGPGLVLTSAHYVALDGLDVSNAAVTLVAIGSGAAPPYVDIADHVLVTRTRLHDAPGALGLIARAATNLDLVDNEFDHAGYGVVASSTDDIRVIGNAFHDLTSTALKIGDGTHSPRVDGNAFWSVGDGVWFGYGDMPDGALDPSLLFEDIDAVFSSNVLSGPMADGVSLRGCANCVLAGNSFAISPSQSVLRLLLGGSPTDATSDDPGLVFVDNLVEILPGTASRGLIDVASTNSATFSHNLWFSADAPIGAFATDGLEIMSPGTLIDTDPLLTAPGSHDLTLRASSPALGAGVPVDGVTIDATGACRAAWNIGAY